MIATNHPVTAERATRTDMHSDARTELVRHAVDLRVHALVMLATAILAAYCGFRVLDLDSSTISGQPLWIAMPPDLLSIGAMAMFIVFATLCMREAHRSWRKAAVAGARTVPVGATAQETAIAAPDRSIGKPLIDLGNFSFRLRPL